MFYIFIIIIIFIRNDRGVILKDNKIIESISKRGNGEIYLGVVGAVRTGKSTFIKKFIENLVVPNIKDEYEKKHCLDEIPQSAQGKTIMTTEPKFVPSNGATIQVDEFQTNIKLIDCVGYIIPGANGYEDENGNPINIFKQPKAISWKKSQKGCCIVAPDGMSYTDEHTWDEIINTKDNLLEQVFYNGRLAWETDLKQVRRNMYPDEVFKI